MTSHFIFPKKWCSKKGRGGSVPKVVKYARRGQFDKMVRALDLGEDVDSTDCQQHSALYYAALNGHTRCLKELLKRGADPNQTSARGLTPCHAVALGGRTAMDLWERDNIETCQAAMTLCVDSMCSLLPHNIHDSYCRRHCLEYLVRYGGNPHIRSKNPDHELPKETAARCGKSYIVRMICEYDSVHAEHVWYTVTNRDWKSMTWVKGKYVRYAPHNLHLALWKLPDAAQQASLQQLQQEHLQKQQQQQQLEHAQEQQRKECKVDATALIPELNPGDVAKLPVYKEYRSVDGSLWSRGVWNEGVHVTLRQIPGGVRRGNSSAIMCAECLLREMDTLSEMRHPNVVLLMARCCGPRQQDMFLALEPLQTGSLHQLLHGERGRISRLDAVGIVSDITRAIAYLHNIQKVAHSMLSSHAVYLSPRGGGKLCNLFCCQPPGTPLPAICVPALRLFLPWMAPELMQKRMTALTSDIFSLGVLLWEVWSGEVPWPGISPQRLGEVLWSGQRLPITHRHYLIAPILMTCFGAPVTRLPAAQLLSQINYIKMTINKC